MDTLSKAANKTSRSLEEWLASRAVKKGGGKGKEVYELTTSLLPTFERYRKELTSSVLATYHVPILFQVSLVSQYDAYLGRLLKTIFSMRPELIDASQKSIALADLTAFTSMESVREFIIEKEVDSLLRESHSAQFDWMENRFGLPLRKDLAAWPVFVEVTERRNLFVHCDGIVSKQYLDVCGKVSAITPEGVKVGDRLGVTRKYFRESFECVFEIGLKLGQVLWRKLLPTQLEAADDNLIDVSFDLLLDERYDLAKTVLSFATTTLKKHFSEESHRILLINYAIAHKWSGDNAKCQEILSSEDWSAVRDDFEMAHAVLQDRVEDAVKIMRKIGARGRIGHEHYATWPVFKEFRKSQQFLNAYKRIFRRTFVVEEKPKGTDAGPTPPTTNQSGNRKNTQGTNGN